MKTVLVAPGAPPPTAAGEAAAAPAHPQARLILPQARAALRLRPGSLRKSEPDRKKGGGGLRHPLDIELRGGVCESGIDAVSRRALENGRA